MANSRKRRKIIVFTVIGLVLAALTVVAILKKKEAVITVQTEKATRRNLTEIVVANGKIQPVMQVVISPEVAGEIVELPVKEGDRVKKGDLLVQIKPDNYRAGRNSAEANYQSAIASKSLARAELEKAEAEFKRNQELFQNKLVSESVFLDFKTAFDVAKLRCENATHYEDQARFGLDKAKDDLSKTTIVSPIEGTITRLKSQLGERVLGTSFNMGTEIMTVSDLNEMEARVDIGEVDVVLIAPGQTVRLEVDAFKDRKFAGAVTEIANSAKGASQFGGGQQDATKFEVKIRIKEKEIFRPGMSVTAEIETRSRTNALTVPIASVTTRQPKEADKKNGGEKKAGSAKSGDTNATVAKADPLPASGTSTNKSDKKSKDAPKPIEVVFVVDGDHAKMVPVKIGISDDSYWEITDGLKEEQEIVSGGYKAISRELEDGKKIRKGPALGEKDEKEKK